MKGIKREGLGLIKKQKNNEKLRGELNVLLHWQQHLCNETLQDKEARLENKSSICKLKPLKILSRLDQVSTRRDEIRHQNRGLLD